MEVAQSTSNADRNDDGVDGQNRQPAQKLTYRRITVHGHARSQRNQRPPPRRFSTVIHRRRTSKNIQIHFKCDYTISRTIL